jgi:hypothetical protein
MLTFVLAATNGTSAADIRSHWAEGEKRTYHFRMGLQSLGTHTAEFVGVEDLPGFGGTCLFEMDVDLDMSPLGHDVKTERTCSLYYSMHGLPRRYIAHYKRDGQVGWIDAVVQRDVFRGFARGLAPDTAFSVRVPPGTYLCDGDFIAQWQMVFADIDLKPGDTHHVDIIIPEDLRRLPMKIVVTGYEPVTVDTATVVCAVARVDLINHRFYVGPDGTLLRAVEPRQGLVVDLMTSEAGEAERPADATTFWRTLSRRLLIWLGFGVWGTILLAILGSKGMKRIDYWVVLAVTGAAFGLVFALQVPLLREVAKVIFTMTGTKGAGIYLGALVTAVISGMFQEALKVGPVFFNWNRFEQKPNLAVMTALGAAGGVGFGLVEACWLAGGAFAAGHVGLLSVVVYERFVKMVFHVGTGVLLGYGVGRRMAWQYWLAAVLLHAFADFSVIFVRQGFVDAIIFISFLTLFYFAIAAYGIALVRRVRRRQ